MKFHQAYFFQDFLLPFLSIEKRKARPAGKTD
jgi:hypothetical protein